MVMDFSVGAGAGTSSDLIPNGRLAWAIINFRGHKDTKEPNETGQRGKFIDLELTIDEGQPDARRKLWHKISDPLWPHNTEKSRQRGMADISRILEVANNAGPGNPDGYRIPNYDVLHGKRVAIKIGIETGTNGFADKNKVADFLTCNPASASFKTYQRLLAGDFGGVAAAAPPAAQASFAGFGAPAAAVAAAPVAGFGAAPAVAAAPLGFGAPAAAAPSPNATTAGTPTAASPSSAPAQPAWLAQANGTA